MCTHVIRIVNVEPENFKDIPDFSSFPYSCKYCLYWEVGGQEFREIGRDVAEKRKMEWFAMAKKTFGDCGKIMYLEGRGVGYAQYAPAELLPNTNTYESGPPSKDAVFISCLFISKHFRRMGLGQKLLESIISELRDRGFKAVETFARRGKEENPSGPIELYKKGFYVENERDKEFPLVRLDL